MDCIFSAVEEQLPLPPERDGALWHFASPGLPLAFHHHRELELNLVTRGQAIYLLDDRRYSLRTGTLVWLFPAQNHILLDRSSEFAMWILVARPRAVERLCEDQASQVLRQSNPSDPYCRQLGSESFHRLCGLLREVSGLEGNAHFNAGMAYTLLSGWAAYRMAEADTLPHRIHPAVQATVRLLREETEATSLKQLAAQFHLSASRLSTLFKEQTGVPLARYRNQQRLDRFLRLCGQEKGPESSLMEAALEAGFGSYAQFYRIFIESMGCSPSEHRAKQDPSES